MDSTIPLSFTQKVLLNSHKQALQQKHTTGHTTGLKYGAYIPLRKINLFITKMAGAEVFVLLHTLMAIRNENAPRDQCTLQQNPKLAEQWIPCTNKEISEITGWSERQIRAYKTKAMNLGLIQTRYSHASCPTQYLIDDFFIEKMVLQFLQGTGADTTHTALPDEKVTLPNTDWDNGKKIPDENVRYSKKGGAQMKPCKHKKLYRLPKSSGCPNSLEPSNSNTKIVLQSSSNTNVFEKDNKTCGLQTKTKTLQLINSNDDLSPQINKIIREWGKLKNGIAHAVGTNVYTRCSKLLTNLLQGHHIQQRKDGKAPLPVQEFYADCLVPESLQTQKWTADQIIDILKLVSSQLDCTIGHSMGLDTVLWNNVKRYSRFLAVATEDQLYERDTCYMALARELHESCIGWDTVPVGTLALQLHKLYQSLPNVSPELFQYTLQWWIKHHTEEYVPQASCVKELTQKWGKVWNARIRDIRKRFHVQEPDLNQNWDAPAQGTDSDWAIALWNRMKTLEATPHPTDEQINAVGEGVTMICVFDRYWKYYPPKSGKHGYFTMVNSEGKEQRVHLADMEAEYLKGVHA